MTGTIERKQSNRVISEITAISYIELQERLHISRSRYCADQLNSPKMKCEITPLKQEGQLNLNNEQNDTREFRKSNIKEKNELNSEKKTINIMKKLTLAPSSPTSHASLQERQPKDFSTPYQGPFHINLQNSNQLHTPQRLIKPLTQTIESKDDCENSVISSLSADDSQILELEAIDCLPKARENVYPSSSRIRSKDNCYHIGDNCFSHHRTTTKGSTTTYQYPLPPTVDRTPKVRIRHTRTNLSTNKVSKPQLSHQGIFRDRPNQSVSTGIRSKPNYLSGTPPRSDRPSSNLRRGRSYSLSVTSDSGDSSFTPCQQSPITSIQDKDLVGQRRRFTPKKRGSHRRLNSGGSAKSTSSGIGSVAHASETSITNTKCQDLYESQNEEEASVGLIRSYNEAERRKVKNVVKEEIKYMVGNLVPKPFKNDKRVVDFSKKVDLKRSNGYLT